MEFDIKIITALIGVGGVVVAALMSSAGYLYRNSTERKKSARKVLYLLLEIRHSTIASLFDPEEATTAYFIYYTARLQDKGIAANPSDVAENQREMVRSHFFNIALSSRTDIENRLLSPFEESLLELASVNPVLAYRLRGREKLEKIAAHTNQYQSEMSKVVSNEINEPWAKNAMLELSKDMKEDALNDLSDMLDKDILILAKACGRSDYRDCKLVLAKAISNKNKYDFEDLDNLLDKFLEQLASAASKEMQRGKE